MDRGRGPTWTEANERLAALPATEAAAIAARLRPAEADPGPQNISGPAPALVYQSWEDYLATTTRTERLHWCATKAKKANAERLMSGRPENRVTGLDVLRVLDAARGRCTYCGSLAVEKRPSKANGAPLPWESVGRRIGSLTHLTTRFDGGENDVANLAWSCLWCNTWPSQRTKGTTDRGGHHSPGK